MRRTTRHLRPIAAVVIGIALVSAVYLGSHEFGGPTVRCGGRIAYAGLGGPAITCRSGGPILFPHSQAGWQMPVAILVGLFGVGIGLALLRRHGPDRQLGNASQAA